MKTDNSPARGTRDLLPEAVAARDRVLAEISAVYRRFGYRRIETPAVEDIGRLTGGQGGENEKLIFQVLKRGLPDPVADGSRIADLVDLGLRYDLTVPLSRFYGNNHSKLPNPFRSFQFGPVWRAERPQKGRYRQFYQCDIDIIGEPSVLAEAELIEGTVQALAAVGLQEVTVRLSDRRFLTALATQMGVPDDATDLYFVILDKLDKIGWSGVRDQLIERGFSKAVSIGTVDTLTSLGEAAPDKLLDTLGDLLPTSSEKFLEDFAATALCLDGIANTHVASGNESDERTRHVNWRFDPTLVRGMGYYTGQIFEISHVGMPGSIAGGGRYDELIGRSLPRDVPACGFSIGFERILDLLNEAPADDRLAILYEDAVSTPVILDLARRFRSVGRAVSPIRRQGKIGAQLERLESWGFTSVIIIRDDDQASDVTRMEERSLGLSR